MTELEKAQIRLSCVNDVIRLKTNEGTLKMYENKTVIYLAKELEKYILGN